MADPVPAVPAPPKMPNRAILVCASGKVLQHGAALEGKYTIIQDQCGQCGSLLGTKRQFQNTTAIDANGVAYWIGIEVPL